jgi:hypothetical protein
MASSTLLQKLDPATDPLVAGTVGSTTNTINRAQSEWFLASSAIALGDWVVFDTSKTGSDRVLYVVPSTNIALGNALVVGVAKSAQATVGGKIEVIVAGYAATAKAVAGVGAAGVPLCVVANAPSAEANVAANIAQPVGVSLAASAAGVAPVWVIKNF